MLKSLDPSSKLLSDITLGRQKLSYSVSDSIGPFFHEKHLQSARQAPGYSLSLDAATTKRGGLQKELDLRITFWDEVSMQVVDHILEILEITTETAEDLRDSILSVLKETGLKVEKLMAVSRDNPNVNRALLRSV